MQSPGIAGLHTHLLLNLSHPILQEPCQTAHLTGKIKYFNNLGKFRVGAPFFVGQFRPLSTRISRLGNIEVFTWYIAKSVPISTKIPG